MATIDPDLDLGGRIALQDGFSAVAARIAGAFRSLHDLVTGRAAALEGAFGRVRVAVAALALSAGVLGGLHRLADASARFERSVAAAGAVAGATAAQLDQFRAAALAAGVATQFDPTQAVEALGALASVTGSVDESLRLLRPSLLLASASLGQLAPDRAAGLATAGLAVFSHDVRDATDLVDRLTQAANLTAIQFTDFATALPAFGRSLSAANQGANDTLITFGLLRNVSMAASVAASSMNRAMVQLSTRGRGAFEGLTHTSIEAHGRMRPLIDLFVDFHRATANLSDAERTAAAQRAFGAFGMAAYNNSMLALERGVRDATGTLLTGAAALAYLRAQMANAGGTAQAFADRMLGTLDGQRTLLRGTLATLAILASGPIAQGLRPLVAAVTAGLNRVIGALQALSPQAHAALVVLVRVVAVAAAGIGLVGGVVALGAAWQLAGTALVAAAAGVASLGAAFVAVLPGLLVGGAVAAALFTRVRRAWTADLDGLRTRLTRFVADVRAVAAGVAAALGSEGGDGIGRVPRALHDRLVRDGLWGVTVRIALWGDRLRRVFRGVVDGLAASAGGALGPLAGFAGRVAGALRGVGGGGVGLSAAGATQLGQTLGRVVGGYLALRGVLLAVAAAQAVANLAAAANPYVLAALALVAVGALVWRHWDRIRAAFAAVGRAVAPVVAVLRAAWGHLAGFLAPVVAAVRAGVGEVWALLRPAFAWLARTARMVFGDLWAGASAAFGGVMRVVRDVWHGLQPMLRAWRDGFAVVMVVVRQVAGVLWGQLRPVLQALGRIFAWVFETMWRNAVATFRGIAAYIGWVYDAARATFGGLRDFILGALRRVAGWLATAIGVLPRALVPDRVLAVVDALQTFSRGGAGPAADGAAAVPAPPPEPAAAPVSRVQRALIDRAAAARPAAAPAPVVHVTVPPAPPRPIELRVDGRVLLRAVERHAEDEQLRTGGHGADD